VYGLSVGTKTPVAIITRYFTQYGSFLQPTASKRQNCSPGILVLAIYSLWGIW